MMLINKKGKLPSPLSKIVPLLNIASQLTAIYFQIPFFLTQIGQKTVSAGGGEALIALLVGLPLIVLSLILSLVSRPSKLAYGLLVLSCAQLSFWMILFIFF